MCRAPHGKTTAAKQLTMNVVLITLLQVKEEDIVPDGVAVLLVLVLMKGVVLVYGIFGGVVKSTHPSRACKAIK